MPESGGGEAAKASHLVVGGHFHGGEGGGAAHGGRGAFPQPEEALFLDDDPAPGGRVMSLGGRDGRGPDKRRAPAPRFPYDPRRQLA